MPAWCSLPMAICSVPLLLWTLTSSGNMNRWQTCSEGEGDGCLYSTFRNLQNIVLYTSSSKITKPLNLPLYGKCLHRISVASFVTLLKHLLEGKTCIITEYKASMACRSPFIESRNIWYLTWTQTTFRTSMYIWCFHNIPCKQLHLHPCLVTLRCA